ncbi:uncharacterized protein LOC126814309 [Patella vulgata]|uniref:uncharacterized protein LOC126814309 n=1 Tax=Patella vulgata TaxID=6465 RepID=UPI0024A830F2|nr:uncharacterized protein LOC126814309 [Patella vulgata]
MGQRKQLKSKRCKDHPDTASIPCTSPGSTETLVKGELTSNESGTGELGHSSPLCENQRNEKCHLRGKHQMIASEQVKGNVAKNMETDELQTAESNLLQSSGTKAELDLPQCSATQETILLAQSSGQDQPKEHLGTGNKELGEKVEQQEKEKGTSEDDNLTVPRFEGGEAETKIEIVDFGQVELGVPTLWKSDRLQTKNEETAEKLDDSLQLAVFDGNKPGGAFGPNPITEENEKLKQENEKLKQEIEMLKQEKGRTNEVKVKSGLQPVAIPLIKRNGCMLQEDQQKFIRKMQFLTEQLNPRDLITTMFSKLLINEDEAEKLRIILENEGRKMCAEKMLLMLLRCGKYAYRIFLKCLELTGYTNVIKELEPNCEIFEGKCKYPGHQYDELIDNRHPKREEFIKKIEEELQEIYPSADILGITNLTGGCVLVTFHLISLGSRTESELREVLESKVNSGYIGDNKVSTEGFSFKKIEGDKGEEMSSVGSVVQDTQLITEQNFNQLQGKIAELQGFNLRLLQHIAELETELEEAEVKSNKRMIDLENENQTLKEQICVLQEQLLGQQRKSDEKVPGATDSSHDTKTTRGKRRRKRKAEEKSNKRMIDLENENQTLKEQICVLQEQLLGQQRKSDEKVPAEEKSNKRMIDLENENQTLKEQICVLQEQLLGQQRKSDEKVPAEEKSNKRMIDLENENQTLKEQICVLQEQLLGQQRKSDEKVPVDVNSIEVPGICRHRSPPRSAPFPAGGISPYSPNYPASRLKPFSGSTEDQTNITQVSGFDIAAGSPSSLVYTSRRKFISEPDNPPPSPESPDSAPKKTIM